MAREELQDIERMFARCDYICDRAISTSIYLAKKLQKPLLVEGPAGVGKTEIAKVLARSLQTELIRLQCYEGLDSHAALYEWNYQRQLLHIKLWEKSAKPLEEVESDIFGDEFLLKRPLLQAISQQKSPVLLIDELDRADEEFESFLLEILSDWQISIPELGTIAATHIPAVIITSNRVRPLSDALRRRCLYLWIDYPTFAKELAIVQRRVPQLDQRLAREICAFIQMLRDQDLEKTPGIVETLDWAASLALLHCQHLQFADIEALLGVICKEHNDVLRMKSGLLRELLEQLDSSLGAYESEGETST